MQMVLMEARVLKLLFMLRLKLYPLIHRLKCKGNLEILIPQEEYIEETGDTEVYMMCSECKKKYHLTNVEPENV